MGKNHNHKKLSRRKFLGQASCAALGSTAMLSSLLDMKLLNAMAVSNIRPLNDYKALVCILLAGGNDSYNMLVPRGNNEYLDYQTIRSTLALPQGSLLPITPNTSDGKEYGVHPSMPEVQGMFEDGNLAFISNVGTLVEPTNKNQYENGLVNLPLGLYSHADQIQQWQTSVPHDRSPYGWGGKVADILQSMNTNQQVSMSISMSGNNVFQSGNTTTAYSVDPFAGEGKTIRGYGDNDDYWNMLRTTAIDNMMAEVYQNILEETYKGTIVSSQAAADMFNDALGQVAPLTTTFSENQLSTSLQMVANTIAARTALGACRQTFYVVIGGWDHHDEVIETQEVMLGVVSAAMKQFYDATVELGIENDVTTFTISDFSRTLTSNGNGSDHAWGGNTMVMGGAVNGKEIYGTYPDLYSDNNLDVGRGVLIPTTSADEYFAELALWFGVSPSDLPLIFPNIGNFYSIGSGVNPIGFLS